MLYLPAMNHDAARTFINALWEDEIVPSLERYIAIPNQSPIFDPQWKEHGFMDAAIQLAHDWVAGREVPNSTLEVWELPGRTPLLFMEIEGQLPGTILMYGHLDKQPPFDGWRTEEGLGPWTPKRVGDRLYGRGGADDGYAIFASVAAVEALQRQGIPLPRIVCAIECSEESGSPDLPYYVDAYADRIGTPDLVVCLDSGCGDYDRLWATTSLRGIVAGNLRVDVLHNGVHSGDASGVVPSSFRVLRSLLSRLEDEKTGVIEAKELNVDIPDERVTQAKVASDVLGEAVWGKFPFVDGMSAVADNGAQLILNKTWRPQLSVTGIDGMPTLEQAGNVLRPTTAVKLSLRVPPTLDAHAATDYVSRLLTSDSPYGAQVSFEGEKAAGGWEAPATAPWLAEAMDEASKLFFDRPAAAIGEGGSIPFMGMLGDKFPQAQFLITGVLGPESNAHGPNEFLHVAYAKKLTMCVAHILTKLPGA
ncbi:MAG: acetylornithine deacetylase/succinyl-diaminopimelate desuccinylase-like protein [Myxococcota bacterium]|jgi:acetylornithine deacetylase/succinyl-diaminopimelate desuccinylase-like protein